MNNQDAMQQITIGNQTLFHGDCITVMAAFPDASVDVFLFDPPYFLPATHYNVRSGSFRSLSELNVLEHFFNLVFQQIKRILKPTGFVYVFCNGQSYPVFFTVAYPHFRAVRPLIWDKLTSVNGYAWRHQHELILFAEAANAPHIKTGDGDVLKERAVPIKERVHLAQKPVPLLKRLLCKVKSKEVGASFVVCDPFMGSASTGMAVEELGGEFLGIDLDGAYFKLVVDGRV